MNELTSQLIQAASSGNVKKLDNLLRQGISPNVRDDYQRSALNWAAVQGHISVVRILLLHGANPDKTTPEGWTPLSLAERKGHIAVAHLLRNFSSSNSGRLPEVGHFLRNQTALIKIMFGADDEDVEIVRALLEKGISSNLDNGYGFTILSCASMSGNFIIVELLLEKGANPNLGNKSFIALELAAGKGYTQIVEVLLTHKADIRAENAEGWTALSSAAANGHIETVKVLLQYGADPTQKGLRNESAIAWAKHKGHQQVVQALSEAQNPQSARTNLLLNDTMIKAIKSDENFTIDLLLTKGADPNSVDADERSALSWAVGNGNLYAIKRLIAYKADINLKDKDGRSPLSYAILNGDDMIVELLLNHGAEPNRLETGVVKPIVVAGSPDPVILRISPLHLASMCGNTQAIAYLISKGADPNSLASNGFTPLHFAAVNDKVDAMKALIIRNADFEATDSDNYTILMAAAYSGSASAARFLVSLGSDVDEQDKYGETALMYAARGNWPEALEALLYAGVDKNIENDQGKTALDTAVSEGNSEIAAILRGQLYSVQHDTEIVPLRQLETPQQTVVQTELHFDQPTSLPNTNNLVNRLNGLTGLVNIKAEITQLINFLRVQQMRRGKGLSVPEQSLHMVFTGNPGTGKTTIARLIAQIYRSMGILSKGQFVETDRAGLVGGYLGQTAIKTQEVVESALGGVLFIDEAYSLTDNTHGHDLYGQEAVATLLKMMEDHRDDLIVIVAGYTVLMQKFIRSNPGLQSRFNKFLHFDDYAPAELTEIFGHFAAQGDYKLHPATTLKLHNVLADLYAARDETFGNARLAWNLFEKAINAHANRMVSAGAVDEVSLVTLYPEDVPNG